MADRLTRRNARPHAAALAARAAAAGACLTAADVLEKELPGLELSPVFRRIYGNPALKARARFGSPGGTRAPLARPRRLGGPAPNGRSRPAPPPAAAPAPLPTPRRRRPRPPPAARCPDPQGLMLIPTADAWAGVSNLAGMQNINLRGENVTAALMTGGLPLYWLAQNSKLDPRTLHVGAPPARIDTEARWRCSLPEKPGSVGYGMVLSRRADGVYVEHGGSNSEGPARLVDPVEPLPGTCPGLSVYLVRPAPGRCGFLWGMPTPRGAARAPGNRAWRALRAAALACDGPCHRAAATASPRPPPCPPPPKVEEVPWPCTSLAALATEIDNASQNGCRRNPDTAVSGALAVGGHKHFLQLLVATGLLPGIDKTSSPFTLLAPTDAALESAAARGAFKYGQLFATNRTLLAQIIGCGCVGFSRDGSVAGAQGAHFDLLGVAAARLLLWAAPVPHERIAECAPPPRAFHQFANRRRRRAPRSMQLPRRVGAGPEAAQPAERRAHGADPHGGRRRLRRSRGTGLGCERHRARRPGHLPRRPHHRG